MVNIAPTNVFLPKRVYWLLGISVLLSGKKSLKRNGSPSLHSGDGKENERIQPSSTLHFRTDIPSSQHRGRSAQHVLLLPVFSVLTHPFQLPFASADRLGDRLSLFNGYPIFASKASC